MFKLTKICNGNELICIITTKVALQFCLKVANGNRSERCASSVTISVTNAFVCSLESSKLCEVNLLIIFVIVIFICCFKLAFIIKFTLLIDNKTTATTIKTCCYLARLS